MSYHVELTQAKPILTAVIRERVPERDLSRFVPAACGEVWTFIKSAGLPRPGRHVALYLDDGSVEVGAEVSEPFTGNDRIHCSQLPEGQVATTTHYGPYERLGDAHNAIGNWCIEQRRELTGIFWEIYGHWESGWHNDSSKIRTDVFHLLYDKEE